MMNDEYVRSRQIRAPLWESGSRSAINDLYGNASGAPTVAVSMEARRPVSATDATRLLSRNAPLQIASVGPSFAIGGVEQHLCALAKFLDPAVAVIKKCLVTDPARLDVNTARLLGPSVKVQAC